MQTINSVAPADTREQTYMLLSQHAPARVVIDTDLAPGQWVVVRAPYQWERERLGLEVSDAAAG